MSVAYRKRGRVVRYENGVLLRVTEAGEAIERGAAFECHPLPGGLENPPYVDHVLDIARSLQALPNLERLIVSEGLAEHEYGDIRWTETTRRVHLSLAANGVRALVDAADFDAPEAARIAAAIARGVREAERPRPLRLAPWVAAALLPSLIGVIEIEQAPAPHDGRGQPILPLPLADGMQWPNWFRPSYRVRPRRMPFHLRAKPFGTVDRDAPEAIALLGAQRLLLEDGRVVSVDPGNILAAGEPGRWYPHGAGSFGAELML